MCEVWMKQSACFNLIGCNLCYSNCIIHNIIKITSLYEIDVFVEQTPNCIKCIVKYFKFMSRNGTWCLLHVPNLFTRQGDWVTAAHEAGCLWFNDWVIHIVLAANRGHSLEILISNGQWPGVGTMCPSVLWTGPVWVVYLRHYFSPCILATQPVCTSCLWVAPERWLLLCT